MLLTSNKLMNPKPYTINKFSNKVTPGDMMTLLAGVMNLLNLKVSTTVKTVMAALFQLCLKEPVLLLAQKIS